MSDTPAFADLGLSSILVKNVAELGYTQPSPIQAQSIPPLLEGHDIIGQAQTGTGKTAAFALPAIDQLDPNSKHPQVLVLAPTRELAMQVAASFSDYTKGMKGITVVPIYGGAAYDTQLRALKRGAQVVVGTPGRVMDHMRRGSLKLDNLCQLVLDEADEMLRMGFIDDVEWVLSHTPQDRQIALFSATMPKEIERIAKTYLTEPVHIKIESKVQTADTIRQRYWMVEHVQKPQALVRILESDDHNGVIVFVRTRLATNELAEFLEKEGFKAAALNGEVSQSQRERTVDSMKKGRIDVLIATDVAARGLDIERIGLVVNYDIPFDAESYVHRIGRTGRAGRSGEAILFVRYRERRMLKTIERVTKKSIEPMMLPSALDLHTRRLSRFQQQMAETLASDDLSAYYDLVKTSAEELSLSPTQIAAALAKMLTGDSLLPPKPEDLEKQRPVRRAHGNKGSDSRSRPPRSRPKKRSNDEQSPSSASDDKPRHKKRRKDNASRKSPSWENQPSQNRSSKRKADSGNSSKPSGNEKATKKPSGRTPRKKAR